MKTCATCNASQNNTVERVIRCGLCVAKQSGNTNWRPMGHNAPHEGPGAASSRTVPLDAVVGPQTKRSEP